MNLTPEPFKPDPSLAEEWDNPAMAEFKRQEAAERMAFAKSHTQEEWRALLEAHHPLPDEPIKLAPKRKRFPFKVVQLPW